MAHIVIQQPTLTMKESLNNTNVSTTAEREEEEGGGRGRGGGGGGRGLSNDDNIVDDADAHQGNGDGASSLWDAWGFFWVYLIQTDQPF